MIKLKKIHLDQIKCEAIACYPYECCGLLVGNINGELHHINDVVPSKNILKNRVNNCFEINPQDRINLERTLRGTREQIIGHFHSHPDCPCTPSRIDLELAHEPKMIWLIVSILEGEFNNFAAYRLDKTAKQYSELSCEIIDGTI
ncbi:MAG: M67 family metallopeptidase [Pseudomonadota bacterium]|nr:M67 family metallopeptidase [Pseudomonadota bacterium]